MAEERRSRPMTRLSCSWPLQHQRLRVIGRSPSLTCRRSAAAAASFAGTYSRFDVGLDLEAARRCLIVVSRSVVARKSKSQRRVTMRQYTLLAALFFALTVTVTAQDKPASDCHVRVLVVKHDWEDGSKKAYGLMSENQVNWWRDNPKKFPGVCLVAEKPADYVIAWTETFTTVAYT